MPMNEDLVRLFDVPLLTGFSDQVSPRETLPLVVPVKANL